MRTPFMLASLIVSLRYSAQLNTLGASDGYQLRYSWRPFADSQSHLDVVHPYCMARAVWLQAMAHVAWRAQQRAPAHMTQMPCACGRFWVAGSAVKKKHGEADWYNVVVVGCGGAGCPIPLCEASCLTKSGKCGGTLWMRMQRDHLHSPSYGQVVWLTLYSHWCWYLRKLAMPVFLPKTACQCMYTCAHNALCMVASCVLHVR